MEALSERPKARLIALVGVSGAGKDTLLRALLGRRPVHRAVSATTRAPRPGEEDGRDYHFLSWQEFQRRAEQGEMFEWVEFHGELYGTLHAELEREGVVVCIRENEGARRMRSELGALVVGVLPPDEETLAARLRGRGQSEEEIRSRLAVDAERRHEIESLADVVIVNDDLERAGDELVALADRLAR